MKIRTDFVTNSSSNSYIVAWTKNPNTIEAFREMTGCDDEICSFLLNVTEDKDQTQEAVKENISESGYFDGSGFGR